MQLATVTRELKLDDAAGVLEASWGDSQASLPEGEIFFLTPEFIDKFRLYHYRFDPATRRMVVVSRDYDKIKRQLLFALTNHGQPYIYVVDGNYRNRGELYLAHKHIGVDVEIKYANECLRNLRRIWGRPVHLQAPIDDDMILFSTEGDEIKQQKIKDDLPKPAHTSFR